MVMWKNERQRHPTSNMDCDICNDVEAESSVTVTVVHIWVHVIYVCIYACGRHRLMPQGSYKQVALLSHTRKLVAETEELSCPSQRNGRTNQSVLDVRVGALNPIGIQTHDCGSLMTID